MSGWSGKSKGGALGYRFFIALIRNTSIQFTYFFIHIVAFYYLIFSSKNAMKFYFREIHEFGKWKTVKSIYHNYCLLGEILVDKIAMLSGIDKGFTFSFEGEHHLRSMSEQGRGGVLIGAHMGNWEVAGQLLDRIDTPVNIVMVEAEHESIRKTLDKVMVNKKIRIIPQKEDYSHLFLINDAFKRNEFVVIHGDRYLPGTNTVTMPFMGKPAQFPSGPLYLASKHKVPVSFVYTLKESSSHYHFYATEGKIFPYPSKIKTRKEEIRKMMESYVESLEIMVRKYPLQWFNYYQFWNEDQNAKS
jgi:predicted LPLAT superfamily acyltransferase